MGIAYLVLAKAAPPVLVDKGAPGETMIDDGPAQADGPTQRSGIKRHARQVSEA